jgi:hypothetical protein
MRSFHAIVFHDQSAGRSRRLGLMEPRP